MVIKHDVSSYNVNNRSLCFSTDRRVARFTNHEDENLLSSLSNRCLKSGGVYVCNFCLLFFFLSATLTWENEFPEAFAFLSVLVIR